MDGMQVVFKLRKNITEIQDSISNGMINGQVDNWDKYKYMVGQLKAYQLVLQEISNLLKDKEQNNDEDADNKPENKN